MRREANAMEADLEAEIAPPPAPAPKPAPKPASVAGVSPSEALEWTGSAFAGLSNSRRKTAPRGGPQPSGRPGTVPRSRLFSKEN